MPGHYQRQIWEPSPAAYPPLARLRRGFAYEAFIPDPIADAEWNLPTHVAEDLVRAETAVRELDHLPHIAGIEALSRLLLRAESISSSHIEGLVVSQRRLAQALYDPTLGGDTARSVVGNIVAMEGAIQLGAAGGPLTVDDICDLHALLLRGTREEPYAGQLRTEQNWIGGKLPAPLDAEYIPPPPGAVPGLMDDLMSFCGREDLPPVFQAAVAHAQFETVHPFVDGNGRVGRALIHLVLRRRGAVHSTVPPISNVLASHPDRYVSGLIAFRDDGIADWCSLFANAGVAASHGARALADAVTSLQREWLHRIEGTRAHSTARRLIELLPASPVLDANRAANLAGSSVVAARNAMMRLQEIGAVRLLKADARRGRIWVADDLLGILNAFEWELASTNTSGGRSAPRPTRVSRQRLQAALHGEEEG